MESRALDRLICTASKRSERRWAHSCVMHLLSGRHRRAPRLPSELEVSSGKTLCVQGEPVRQFIALMDGHAVAIVDDMLHHSLCPISVVGWPEVVSTGHASATIVTTSIVRVRVLTPLECVDTFGATASVETVLATLKELASQPL